jgi:hypothetical protein
VSAIDKRYAAARVDNMRPGVTAQLFVVHAGDLSVVEDRNVAVHVLELDD